MSPATVNDLSSSAYQVTWAHLVRPVRVPCGESPHWKAGIRYLIGHFPHPDGGCFYGCEEDT